MSGSNWSHTREPHRWQRCALLLAACGALAACGSPDSAATTAQPRPTPTMSPLFADPVTEVPTPVTPTAIRTPAPTRDRAATPEAAASAEASATPDIAYEYQPIYTDKLAAGWGTAQSQNMKLSLASRTEVYTGTAAILAQPQAGYGRLFFTRQKGAAPLLRSKVLGVSFWVNGGDNEVKLDDLLIAVEGSNDYSYWVKTDSSVERPPDANPKDPLFPETRLYFLGYNRAFPANRWTEVVLWLDDLIYDPQYTYVTGVAIINDEKRLTPFSIDHVRLMVRPEQ